MDLENSVRDYLKENGIDRSEHEIQKLTNNLEKRIDKSAKRLVKKYRAEMEPETKKWWQIWKLKKSL